MKFKKAPNKNIRICMDGYEIMNKIDFQIDKIDFQ